MVDYEKIKEKFQPGTQYSYKQILKIICPTQSTTADYIFNDMLCTGYFQRTINGYRINI